MKILTLPVNKAAFDMLADPNPETRKNEEYRRTCEHWERIFLRNVFVKGVQVAYPYEGCALGPDFISKFDAVKFTNGYGHKVPSVIREWKGLTIGKPNPLWVPTGFLDLDKHYFRIELGEIII